jgi:hypothetical protein
MLHGHKTYLTAGLIALTTFAKMMGWVTPDTADTATNLLLGGGLAFLRMGVARK